MSILQLPPDTAKTRRLLFTMPVPFSMHAAEFERYWPLVDNIWSRYDEINVMGPDKIPYDSIRFSCRFARKFKHESTPPESKRQRREGATCSCRVKAKRYHGVPGLPDHYRFEHSSNKESDWTHSHSIDDSDSVKINGFLKLAAAVEAARGFRPAEVYANLKSVKLLDAEGVPIGDALDAAGGKFMTRAHATNARQSALSATGAKLGKRGRPLAHTGNGLQAQLPDAKDRASQMAEAIAVDPSTVWPNTLGKTSEDREEHAKFIKNDIRSLVQSIAIGARTHVPKDVIIPLLNSIAEYMDDEANDGDGKPFLETILKMQNRTALLNKQEAASPDAVFNPWDGYG